MLKCGKCGQPATAGRGLQGKGNPVCISCAALDKVLLPETPEVRKPAPARITSSPAWQAAARLSPDGALWSHQSEALEALARDKNAVIATPTASGKSLVFQVWTLYRLTENPEAAALVFYPTKALSNDQERRWKAACRAAGMPENAVSTVNGDVGQDLREERLRSSRIIMTTPDVTHAWTTRMAARPAVAEFLSSLEVVVIDEAHAYEDVFGSNSLYLFRRLTAAAVNAGNPRPPRIIAATATIREPGEHMRRLTGQEFEVIGEERNGAPNRQRLLAHMPADFRRAGREGSLAKAVRDILENDPEAQVIAFHDSRQGIERVAEAIGRKDAVSYRSGYQSRARRRIEDALREGKVRAVVATPALELGIDMPDLSHGVNLGLPHTRKQIRQRTGRVGRSRPGTFVILAPESAFAEHGDTLAGYYRSAVEPSYLHTANEYIAYQHALCLKAELEAAGLDTLSPPAWCDWPEGFDLALKNAHGRPPHHLYGISRRLAETLPHLACGLRDAGEENLKMTDPDSGQFETIDIGHALREAYPGAVYRHRGKTFRIAKWARKRQSMEAFITAKRIRPEKKATRPLQRKVATTALSRERIVGNRLERRIRGEVAHLDVTITESVEGYYDLNGALKEYGKLAKTDPNQTRKQRDIPTTGVLIRIREPWFAGDAGDPWQARIRIAQALRKHLAYRRSIAAAEIGVVTDNIFLKTDLGYRLSDCAVLIYDRVHGGLGLTEDLWTNLREYANALKSGTERDAGGSREGTIRLDGRYAQALCLWLDPANDGPGEEEPPPGVQDAWRIVRPGSKATIYDPAAGESGPGTVGEPVWRDGVRYRAKTAQGEEVIVDDDALEMPGYPFDWALWEPASGWIGEIPVEYVTERTK